MKSSRELYGLINFGELRKRLGSQLDDKTGVKLRELIFKGHTTVRVKGKIHRLRTPTCAALKRLNEDNAGLRNTSGTVDGVKSSKEVEASVPSKLTLNLHPASREDFERVHLNALTNASVTLTVRPSRCLASVIEHLEAKWRPLDEHRLKSIFPSAAGLKSSDLEEELWLMPKPGSKLASPSISVIGPTTSASLSLSNLQTKLEAQSESEPSSTKSSESPPTTTMEDFDSSEQLTTQEQQQQDNNKSDIDMPGGETTTTTTTTDQSHNIKSEEQQQGGGCYNNSDKELQSQQQQQQQQQESTSSVNNSSWNLQSAKCLSIGELFLMLGIQTAKGVLELQYTWKKKKTLIIGVNPLLLIGVIHPSSTPLNPVNPSILSSLARLASSELAKKQTAKSIGGSNNSPSVNKASIPNGTSPKASSKSLSFERPNSPLLVQHPVLSSITETPSQPGNAAGSDENTTGYEFRRPSVPLPKPTIQQQQQHQAFRQQFENLMPRYNMRKGRPLSRPKRTQPIGMYQQ
jgi:hypothetical protein